MILLITSSIIFVAYITTMCAIFGVPESISETYYLLENIPVSLRKNAGKTNQEYYRLLQEVKGGKGLLFMFFLCAVGFTLFPYWVSICPENTQLLTFLAAGGIVMTGAAHDFKKYGRAVHFGGAITSALATTLWLCLNGFWNIPLCCLAIAGAVTIIRYPKQWLFWFEAAAFVALFTSLIINR